MLFRVFLFFLVFLIIEVNAQNLVPNPSFETGAWVQANGGSADYLNASNVFGNQTPRTGTKYMGFAFGNQGQSGFREYIKAPLISPLIVGESYLVEMWVSLGDTYGTYGCNNQCFAFTTYNLYFSGSNYMPIPMTPQYVNPTPITDQLNWTLVSTCFYADSAYTYLTIGNFFDDANTSFVFVGGNNFSYGYYFVEDVSVTLMSIPSGPPGQWTWTGAQSIDWFSPCNWDKISVPSLTSDVLIPGGTLNNPWIIADTGYCKTNTIDVSNGAHLNIMHVTDGHLIISP